MSGGFIRNRFSGSLKPLKNLTQLQTLNINNTDIDSGLEYLPFDLENFYCSADEEGNMKVKKLETELKKFDESKNNTEDSDREEDENFMLLLNQ